MKFYGLIGLLMILFLEVNFFILDIEVIEKLYFPFMWLGYILFVDALAYQLRGRSWIRNGFPAFIGMFIISAPFWKLFEYVNIRVDNWHYTGTEYFGVYADLFAFISFSTVIPAFFVTLSLFAPKTKQTIPKKAISKKSFVFFVFLGVLMFVLIMVYPKYFYAFEWLFLFFIIDSINYHNKQPSILYAIRKRQRILWSIVASILILGFFWEFWNYWASVKWTYAVPFVDFWKIFEMPLLGYLGYVPFGFSIYSFYHFVKYLFNKESI